MICPCKSSHTNGTIIFGEQPNGSARKYSDRIYIGSTPRLAGSRHLFESLRTRIKTMSTVIISQQPQKTAGVFVHSVYTIVSQADKTSLACLIGFKRVSIEAVYPIPGREPEIAFMVLQNAHYSVLRQTFLRRIMGEETATLGISRQRDTQKCYQK